MSQERLIELVREYTFLYDINDRRYGDNVRKDEAWRQIAKELRINDAECKKAWALLRDAFRRAIKKHKENKSLTGNTIRKKWKYEDEMSFLLPYIKERAPNTNVFANAVDKVSDTEENLSDADNQAKSPEVIIAYSTPSPNWTNVSEGNVTQPSTSKIPYPISISENHMPLQKRSKFRKGLLPRSTANETLTNTLMKFVLENKKTNDIQQFFESMATTVQSFPPRDRAIAKAKVFNVISEMEMEILGRESSTHSESEDSPASFQPKQEPENDFYNTP